MREPLRLAEPCGSCDGGALNGDVCLRCGGHGIVLTPDGREIVRMLQALGVNIHGFREPAAGWQLAGP